MKRTITLIAILLLCAVSLFAQAPEKFSYQAVVRNASNALVTNAPVGVRVSILQGNAAGNAVYVETHSANANANGLLTVEIGGGSVQQGVFADIDWANGPYFLKTETDPNGGSSYTVTSTQQLLSVPYALYAEEAGNGFSGDYNDLTNTPQIPQSVGELANDANYITVNDIPEIPTVPTNVSAFTNDVPYLTAEQQILSISNDTIFLTGGSFVKLPESFSGDYNDLTNRPEIQEIPDSVSAFVNDAGYITMADLQILLDGLNNTIDSLRDRIEDLENGENPTMPDTIPNTSDTSSTSVNTIFPCTTSALHPAQTSSAYQNNGFNGANHGLETVNDAGEIVSVTDYDGNEYPVVQIGSQCWLAENMRCTHSPKSGHRIVGSPFDSYSSKVAAWYGEGGIVDTGDSNQMTFDSAACVEHHFGLLYNWCAAMDTANPTNYVEVATVSTDQYNFWDYTPTGADRQGICPTGWHVPGYDEWTVLMQTQSPLGKLAGGNDWENYCEYCDGYPGDYAYADRNSSGFSAVPAGYFYEYYFHGAGVETGFWSSTQSCGKRAQLCFLQEEGEVGNNRKTYGQSVRCLRDDPTLVFAPAISTSVPVNVTSNSATLKAIITNPDNVDITEMGFEWYYSSSFALYQTQQAIGSNMGDTVTANLTGLAAGTFYSFRAFITYGDTTIYGSILTFSTSASESPIVSSNPCTINASHSAQTGTAYHGNGYNGADHGLEKVVNGKISSVTDYDGNEYPVVQIGSQCWLAENLRCTHSPKSGHRIVGIPLTSYGSKQAAWKTYAGGYMQDFLGVDGNEEFPPIDSIECISHHFGLLYNWCAAMDTANPTNYVEVAIETSNNNTPWSYGATSGSSVNYQGICPIGWHVPRDAEWENLVQTWSEVELAGGNDWSFYDTQHEPNWNASGFSAVPVVGLFFSATFWSSTRSGSSNSVVKACTIGNSGNSIYDTISFHDKSNEYSVRCVRD